ncbi:hypothetical protein CK203_038551 [Vitis vinifera]|uniref:Uncharacterized protein n=2 Tax=Vitis vinifera TaxID=29760 RepID=A0A438I3Z3_VITVI|nr:hypothetical protein CK203_038551 [Vitis vinifera]
MKLRKQSPTSFCYILEAQVRETFGMSMRKDIRKGWEDFCYRIAICVKMVDGQNFGGENQLKEAFPLLFKQASSKKATVADLCEGGNRGQGLEQFKIPFQD